MPLTVTIGRKGYIILPKAVRELAGVKEGDKLTVKVENGKIILEPEITVDIDDFRKKIREHWSRISTYVKTKPRLGDLASISLEEEFENDVH